MCFTSTDTMMDTDEDDKFEAQVAKYNIHFKALMALIPISQYEHEFDSDDEINGLGETNLKEKNKKGKKGKHNPPGGKYGSKVSKKQKNQYKHGMSLADALKTKQKARKLSKSKGRKDKFKDGQDKPKDRQDKPKRKHDKFKGKLNRFKSKADGKAN